MKKLFFAAFLVVLCFVCSSTAQTTKNKTEQLLVLKAASPTYIPAAALAVRAEGKVEIEVKINREGKVESAKAISGHKLFQKLAEIFAEQWLFNIDEKAEKNRFATLTFVFHRVPTHKEEITLFLPPYQVELFYYPPEIVQTVNRDPANKPLKLKKPKVIKYFAPKYPPAARATRTKGEVIVTVKIDDEGKVVSAEVESGHVLLRKACEDAAKQWIFAVDKKIVEREVKIVFAFIENNKYKVENYKIKFKKPYRLEIIFPQSRVDY